MKAKGNSKDFEQYVPKVRFELIPIKNLTSNQEYQRNLSTSHIRRTAENFDLCQVNLVKVSRRDGINHVINGQHTVETVAIVSSSRDTPVWCMVYDDLDYKREADIFAKQQKYTKYLSPYEVFKANMEAGNDEQLIIKDLVESYKLAITPQPKSSCSICAVSTLEYIYRLHGFQVLDRTLRLCVSTWEGDVDSLSANMLRGVARLIVAFGDALKDDIFREKIGSLSARKISRIAKDRNAGTRGYAEAMLDIYNRRIPNPLQFSKLHAKKSTVTDVADATP